MGKGGTATNPGSNGQSPCEVLSPAGGYHITAVVWLMSVPGAQRPRPSAIHEE